MEMFAFILKYALVFFSAAGIVFHLMVLRNPMKGDEVEKKLQKEFGVKTRIAPKLEQPNMELHHRLISSKTYNIFATIFLILLLLLLLR